MMSNYYKRIVNFAIVILLITQLSCVEKSHKTIRVGVLQGPTLVSFLPMMKNPPEISGKNIEFIVKNDPQQIQALLLKKELDFAVLPTVMAANLYNKGLKYSMVACPVWGTLYIVTTNQKINNINDLKHQTISVFGQGATSDVLLGRFIQSNKLENIKIDYSFSSNMDLSLAVLNNRVTTAVISEPMVSMLLKKNHSLKIISRLNCEAYIKNKDKDIFVQTAFIVRNDFAEDFPTLMNHICESYAESCNKVKTNPDFMAQLMMEQHLVADKQTALNSLPLCNIQYVAAFAINEKINQYLQIFYDYNPSTIGNQLPDRNFIYRPH